MANDSHDQLDALKRSELELTDFFENAPVPFRWVRPDGIIVRANRAELEVFGYSRDEYVGHHIGEFYVNAEASREILERLGRGETLRDYEVRVRAKDGSVRHVLLNSSALWQNGKFIHTRCCTRDISSRKRAERRMAMEHGVTRALAESHALAEASVKVLQVIGECLECDFGALWQPEQDSGALRCVQVWRTITTDLSLFEASSRNLRLTRGVGLPGRVWESGAAAWIADVSRDGNFPRADAAAAQGLRGGLAFPIKLAGEVRAIVEFFSRELREPDAALLQSIETVGSEIGQFVERLHAQNELQQKNAELRGAITEFEAVQEELKAQNEELFQIRIAVENERRRYQDLFEFAPDGYLVTDLGGKILEANQAAARQLNTPVAALVGSSIVAFVEPQQQPAIASALADLPAADEVTKIAVRLLPHAARTLEAVLTVGAVRDPWGKPTGLRWLIHDVTESKRIENALRLSEERLRRQSQELEQQLIASGRLVSLGEITASMAHEFNNPLGIIMGFVEDILSTMDPADPNYRSLKIIDEESRRCKKIISDLMEYARPRGMDVCPTDVGAIIDKTLQLIEPRVSKQNVALEKNIASGLPKINADPQQLEQVFVNLYLNAIDAMPSGGKLTVEAKLDSAAAPAVAIAVTDTGFGIDPQHRPRIFQPFFTAKKRTGLGLGLPVCERIVKNHGGRIEMESTPGTGTTFRILLPAGQTSRNAVSNSAA